MTDAEVKEILRASMSPPPADGINLDAAIRGGRRRRATRRGASLAAVALAMAGVAIYGTTVGTAGTPTEPSTAGLNLAPPDHRTHPSVTDPIFAGLPPQVVNEVLQNPEAQANIAMPVSGQARDALWQGMVGNFVFCRQMLSFYETWHSTGAKPASFPTPVTPEHPLSSYQDVLNTYAFYKTRVATGDIRVLQDLLLNDSGCGKWIPATPGDSTGPTIADVVRALTP